MEYITAIEMSIDDVMIRSPKVGGMTRKKEKIWSKNAGRTASAKMQGTIIAIKTTYSIEWPPLTVAEQNIIEDIISDKDKPFHILKVKRPDGSVDKVQCYFGTPTFPEWEMFGGEWRCVGAKVDAIER